VLGQTAYLDIVPGEVPVSIALLTNDADSESLHRELFAELLSEYAGATMPAPLEPPASPVARGSLDIVGSYERALMSFDVEDRDGALVLVARPSGVLAMTLGTDRIESEMVPFAEDVYLVEVPGRPGWLPVVFYRLPDGTPCLQVSGQASPRAALGAMHGQPGAAP
jgi:hypothetical protein